MKTSQQILARIDDVIEYAIENPRGYAPSPKALEGLFLAWENLREFIILGKSTSGSEGYSPFLYSQGYDVGGRLPGTESRTSAAQVEEDFIVIAEFWREFIRSNHRIKTPPNSNGNG